MDETSSIIKPNILMVEDDPSDIRLTEEALKGIGLKKNLYIVKDGVEATEFLSQQGQYKDVPRPDLILLDLTLPRKDGWEVLKEIKNDEKLKLIPVIIITMSTDPKTINNAYRLQANSVFIKPLDIGEFNKYIKAINDFWFNAAQLPIKSPV
jgi:two-component system response regulator